MQSRGVGTVAAIAALAATLFDQVISYPCCHKIKIGISIHCAKQRFFRAKAVERLLSFAFRLWRRKLEFPQLECNRLNKKLAPLETANDEC